MEKKKSDAFLKAKNYAFCLLKFRLRSEKEIYQRLKRKKFDPQIIKETISFLKDKDFIDDHHFARAWIESRLRKPLGLRKLKQELRIKGIDQEIIDHQIEQIKQNYAEEDIVLKLVKKRLNKLKDIEPQKAKKRLYLYLLRRGFSPEVVIDVIENLEGHPDS